ncbi:MAG: MBL fold metallo-hydrolase [Cardiobacteriales bacterium]|nr:MAG: MBL fold metallo-hydrolase [Gammaproteobacteria bacterium]PIE82667.1 MAG: MBL fold metallo-hydrolase [Cardiobacteriales bacterium]
MSHNENTCIVKTLSLGVMDNFIHLLIDANSRAAFVVDPAWDSQAIMAALNQHNATLSGILLTHSHADHVSAVKDLLAVKNVPVYVSESEYRLGKIRLDNPCFVADGQTLVLGDSRVQVIATPGHTLGSVCYYAKPHLICGDTLFIDGCGRCDFAESDVEQMWDSLQRLKSLPDATLIYCGHHYGQKMVDSLAGQKQTNPYLLIDNKDFFIDFRMHLQSQYRRIPFVPSSAAEMAGIYQRHCR